MRILINSPAGFDIFELTDLAADRGFDGIQLYLNPELAADPERLEEWRDRTESMGLCLAVHLPPDPHRPVLEALNRVLRQETPVISHYPDQRHLPDKGGVAAWEFSPFGILPVEYDTWLDDCRMEGVLPVFDLPRVFRDTDEQDAARFANGLFTRLAGSRYILHLIDCGTDGQERDQWCELGKGRVGRYLEQAAIPQPELVVLEYESLIQSVNSLSWLRRLALVLGL